MNTNNRWQLYPLARVGIFFVFGIVTADLFTPQLSSSTWLFSAFGSLCLVLLARKKYLLQSCLLLLAAFLTGGWLFGNEQQTFYPSFSSSPTTHKAVLLNEPSIHGKVLFCDLLMADGVLKNRKVKAVILRDTLSEADRQLATGTGIDFYGTLEPLENHSSNPHFNTLRMLHAKGFVAQTFIFRGDWQTCQTPTAPLSRGNRFLLTALKMRQQLLDTYRRYAPSIEIQSVLAAMTLGDKQLLPRSLKDIYAASGASHLLALSGLHLGIIYMVLLMLTRRMRSALLRGLLVLSAVWTYVFIAGAAVSLLRAALMASVYTLVSVMQRTHLSFNALSCTAIVLLACHPSMLWDVSFQMSFATVLSIIVFYPPICRCIACWRWANRWWLKSLWSLIAVSLAAQIGVAPIVLYYFGTFPVYFLLTNLAAIPLATLILYTALTVFAATPLPALQALLMKALVAFTALLNSTLCTIASLPFAQIVHVRLNLAQVILAYILMGCLYAAAKYLVMARRSQRLAPFLHSSAHASESVSQKDDSASTKSFVSN